MRLLENFTYLTVNGISTAATLPPNLDPLNASPTPECT